MAQKTSNIFETQQGSALGPPLGPPHLQMVTVKAVVAVYVICSALSSRGTMRVQQRSVALIVCETD